MARPQLIRRVAPLFFALALQGAVKTSEGAARPLSMGWGASNATFGKVLLRV